MGILERAWGGIKDFAKSGFEDDPGTQNYEQGLQQITATKDAENVANKASFASETARSAEGTLAGLQNLQQQGAGQDTAGNRRLALDRLGAVQRATLANAAENGWIRSRALDDARLLAGKQQALAMAGMKAAEEEGIRSELQKRSAELQATKTAQQNIPTEATTTKKWDAPVFVDERSRIDEASRNSEAIIEGLNRNRPSADQMRSSFASEVDKSLSAIQQEMIRDATARGMPTSYIAAIPQRIAQERQAAGDEINRWVTVLSGADPGAIQSELAALYNPDTIEEVYQKRTNPTYGLLAGLIGAGIGSVGGPAGSAAGYQIGSGVGSMFATGLEG